MRKSNVFAVLVSLCLCACQPAPDEEEPKPKPHQPAVLDYTMLGIWSERYQAYEISNALEEVGIGSTMSGIRPCIHNVETRKWREAWHLLDSNPHWLNLAIKLNREPGMFAD